MDHARGSVQRHAVRRPGTNTATAYQKRFLPSLLSVPQKLGETVQYEADQATHQRAVDPDELKIPPHLQLDAPRGLVGVPHAHRVGDELADLVPVLVHGPQDRSDEPLVQLLE